MSRPYAVAFCGMFIDACAFWRVYQPHFQFQNSSFYIFLKNPDWKRLATYDYIVVQRLFLKEHLDFVRTCRSLGLKIIYDLDDNIFNITKSNKRAQILLKHADGFREAMSTVDCISVSTNHLALEIKSRHAKDLRNAQTGKLVPVMVNKNAIDARLFTQPWKDPNNFIVGWAGSDSHVDDIKHVEKPLITSMVENPNIMFEFRGMVPSASFRKQNFRHRLWTPVEEFGSRMPRWGWSIGLAPLDSHRFNQSKSSIKGMESGWCGIPCLMSCEAPYTTFVGEHEQLKWLLFTLPQEFYRKLRTLINEPAQCEYYGKLLQEHTVSNYTFQGNPEFYLGWKNTFDAAMNG